MCSLRALSDSTTNNFSERLLIAVVSIGVTARDVQWIHFSYEFRVSGPAVFRDFSAAGVYH